MSRQLNPSHPVVSSWRVRVVALALLANALTSGVARGQTLEEKARTFAGTNARVVTRTITNPAQPGSSRQITRTFVPILPGQEQSFVDAFCTSGSCVLMARRPVNPGYPYHEYTRVITKGSDGVLTAWSSTSDNGPMSAGPAAAPFIQHQPMARYVVANLGEAGMSAALAFLQAYRTREVLGPPVPHGSPFNNEYYGIGQYRAAKQAANQPVGDVTAACMWWLPNLETRPNQTLTQSFGCRRTRGPQEVPALAHHGATSESVPVIGVAVDSLATFQGLGEDALLGPKPTHGAYGSWIR